MPDHRAAGSEAKPVAITRNITKDDDWFTGEDKSLVFTIYQSNETTAQDITGWALSYRLKRSPADADGDAVLTKTTGSGIALTTPLSGICTVTIEDTDTDSLDPRTYFHELKRTNAGNETVLTTGSVLLQQAIHRA